MGTNPNTISAGIKEVWDVVYQVTHHKLPVYPAFSNFRLSAQLKKGDTVNRHYPSEFVANDMGGDGSYTRQPLVDTQEELVINKEKETSFYIKELDELQNHLPTRKEYANQAMAAIFNQIDADVLGDYDQYTNDLDDGDLGGTNGNGITPTVSNVRKLFTQSLKKLQRANVAINTGLKFTGFRAGDAVNGRRVAILSPDVETLLLESLDGKDTALGDKVGINGHIGRYMGFDLFVSNGVGWSGTLAFGVTDFSAGDTVIINGVTLTFATPVGAVAGTVLLGGTVADSIDALVACINDSESLSAAKGGDGPATVGTDYVELSLVNRNLLKNVVATDGATELTIKATGKGFVSVSVSATPGDIIWTTTKQVQHLLFGVNNAIDLVIQKQPSMLIKDRDGKVGKDFVTWTAYGKKVFNEQLVKMVNVKIRTDEY